MTESSYEYFEAKAEFKSACEHVGELCYDFEKTVEDNRLSTMIEQYGDDIEKGDYIPDDLCDELIDKVNDVANGLDDVEDSSVYDHITSDLHACMSRNETKIPSNLYSTLDDQISEIETALEEVSSCWDTCAELFDAPDDPMGEDDYADGDEYF